MSNPRRSTRNKHVENLSSYVEQQWDETAMHLLETTRKQSLVTTFSTLDGLLNQLKADTGTLKADTETMKADIGTMKADIGTLKADTETMKADIGTLKADTETMKADIGTLKSEVQQIRTDINTNMNQLKTELIAEFQNVLQQNISQVIQRQIKTLLLDTANNMA
ncbi:uncharacterized protein LOC135135253 [Zophobas morio]|uniref:uncharacterized protein LOC135135253 n=1 Tax=Zophobas morio TaxID=2755281 RepID=UPI0030831EAF